MQKQSELTYIDRSDVAAMWFMSNSPHLKKKFLAWRLHRLLRKMMRLAAYAKPFDRYNEKATTLANAIFMADKELRPDYEQTVHEMKLLEFINGFTHKEVIPDDQLLSD
jgi:hypothetical protein